jgi:hypothetical protein
VPKNKFEQIKVDGLSITLPAGSKVKFVTPTGVMRLQENGINVAGEGGRIAMVADNTEDDRMTEDMKLAGCSAVLNFRKDEPMEEYPIKASTAFDGGVRYSMILIEHAPAT